MRQHNMYFQSNAWAWTFSKAIGLWLNLLNELYHSAAHEETSTCLRHIISFLIPSYSAFMRSVGKITNWSQCFPSPNRVFGGLLEQVNTIISIIIIIFERLRFNQTLLLYFNKQIPKTVIIGGPAKKFMHPQEYYHWRATKTTLTCQVS